MSTISSSITLNSTNIATYTFPITINGGNPSNNIVVTFGSDLVFTSSDNYFIIGSEYVTIDGGHNIITIDGIGNYIGLIRNGTGTAGVIDNGSVYNNITIKNIGVVRINSSSLLVGAGWICQMYFGNSGTNITVEHCHSTGPIAGLSGGVLGQYSYATVTNCYSAGNMSDNNSGGIFGGNCYNSSATNCYSTGDIGYTGGGIFGQQCSGSTAVNCYSTGSIGVWSGGIFGYDSSSITVTNCYSTGSIGNGGGGIVGASCNGIFNNCYTIGNIGTDAGGILGLGASGTMTNCLSTDNNTWLNSEANSVLTNTSSYSSPLYTLGITWINVMPSTNNPYKLVSFFRSPYNPISLSINMGNEGNTTTDKTGTFNIIAVKTPSISPNYSTSYSNISINSSTGKLTFSNSLPSNVYTILVYMYDSSGGYSVSNYTLTVKTPCFAKGTKILCRINGEEKYLLIEDIQIGTEIKTYGNSNFVKLYAKSKMLFNNDPKDKRHALYVSRNTGLYITGGHNILINKKTSNMIYDMGLQKVCDNNNFRRMRDTNQYTLYHLVLESNDDNTIYGIWANDILCESMSKHAHSLYFNN